MAQGFGPLAVERVLVVIARRAALRRMMAAAVSARNACATASLSCWSLFTAIIMRGLRKNVGRGRKSGRSTVLLPGLAPPNNSRLVAFAMPPAATSNKDHKEGLPFCRHFVRRLPAGSDVGRSLGSGCGFGSCAP